MCRFAIATSTTLLDIAQEQTRVGFFEWEVEADRVTWSSGLYRILGLEPGEMPGTCEGYLDRVHPDEREERRETIERVLMTGRSAEGEHRIIRPDGEVRWVESGIRVIPDDAGRPARLVGVCQDVTERRQATEKL